MTVADRFVAELQKLVLEEIEYHKENIANGVAMDHADYKRMVGLMQGLAKVFDLIEIADRNVKER